jgi:hypothetical protein
MAMNGWQLRILLGTVATSFKDSMEAFAGKTH